MINLRNDYCGICHKKVLENLNKYSNDDFLGYGLDEHSLKAKELIKKELGRDDVDIHFLVGGTVTNKVLISHILRPYEAVISPDTGHINVHETGTIEQSGHKVITTLNKDGKITKDDILEVLRLHTDEHMVKPKMVYITNATEIGTIYKYQELKEISDVCKENNLYLYLDGARLGSALTSEKNDIKLSDLVNLVDAFYIGGTKNGLMLGEALVVVNDKIKEEMRYSIKHFGGMYAKGFVAGLQFEALFEDGLFYEIAKEENRLANKLYTELVKLGVEFESEQVTNQIFLVFDNDKIDKLKEHIHFEIWSVNKNKTTIRFVSHFLLTDELVDKTIEIIKEII